MTWLQATDQRWKVALSVCGAAITLGCFAWFIRALSHDESQIGLRLIAFTVCGGTTITWLLFAIRCPSCGHRPVGQLMRTERFDSWLVALIALERCPRCSASGSLLSTPTTSLFTVYDPRESRSYEINSGGSRPPFSSAALEILVIEATGIEWDPSLIDRCLSQSGSYGFAAVSPWVPGAEHLTEHFRRLVADVARVADFECGLFPYDTDIFRALVQLRADSGGWASGQWCIGTFSRPTRFEGDRFKELGGFLEGFALAQSEALGCALVLGEHQQSLFLIRLGPEVVDPLNQLMQSLKAHSNDSRKPTR